jgi:hypothetical protein
MQDHLRVTRVYSKRVGRVVGFVRL